jgi:hypothetical protein
MRSSPDSLPLPCRGFSVHIARRTLAPFRFATSSTCLAIIRSDRRSRSEQLLPWHLSFCRFRKLGKHPYDTKSEMFRSIPQIVLKRARSCPRSFTLITRTASCSRQLPSCVAVYPRDSRSRRVLCRSSHSLHSSFCIHPFYFRLQVPNAQRHRSGSIAATRSLAG